MFRLVGSQKSARACLPMFRPPMIHTKTKSMFGSKRVNIKSSIRKNAGFAQESHIFDIKHKNAIKDLQNAKLLRNKEFVNLQIRKLAFSTRINSWARRNFTILIHLAILGIGSWILLDTTKVLSVFLLGLSAINLQKWLNLCVGSAIGYQLSADVTVDKIIPKWKKNSISIRNMSIKRDAETAVKINGAVMDMDIEVIDIKVSLMHILTGRGILSELSISGLKGTLDRRTTIWTEEMQAMHRKREATDSDFYLDHFKLKDVSLTIHQKFPDRPLQLDIFSLKLPRLRQHWLLLDILNATSGHGKFDNCLFSVENIETDFDKQSRRNHFKIDGLDFDLVSSSYSEGLLSWIDQGFMDIDCYYDVPMYALDERVLRYNPKISSTVHYFTNFDMALSLNNINIVLPNVVTSNDISLTNYAMVQPIVAYFNTNYVKVPMQLNFQLPMDDFCGSWYPGEANLYTSISNGCYDESLRLIGKQKEYKRVSELFIMGVEGCYRGVKYFLEESWKTLTS